MTDHPEADDPKAVDDEVFSYQTLKDGRVLISWHSRLVVTLKGEKAKKFLTRMEDADPTAAQLIMAKATGNFKRGNERAGKQSRR
ncbi:MAG TPA: hypothetical protein PLD47_08540 [Aggregatilineales bacterium]|nr:hypothetical protein [Anaerolineales bacterium]HRE47759.1 hypothetical protein [Aggregatilineales bacterium]